MWKKCLDCIDELLDILFENNNIFIGENIAEDSENLGISDQVSHPFSVCLSFLLKKNFRFQFVVSGEHVCLYLHHQCIYIY